MELSEIEALLSEPQESKEYQWPRVEQKGPLRQFDNEMRCASRGCRSPTHFKVKGIPYCMIHAMRKLNDMLIELGVEA
jgi:hypothetical protein